MNEPVHAGLAVRGVLPEEVFAALLDVGSFPDWGFGLKRASVREGAGLVPGARLEFVLSAVGLMYEVVGTITMVEVPARISWRYIRGAVGRGGWILEENGDGTRTTLSSDYEVEPALHRAIREPLKATSDSTPGARAGKSRSLRHRKAGQKFALRGGSLGDPIPS
jgi:hypothetical protein